MGNFTSSNVYTDYRWMKPTLDVNKNLIYSPFPLKHNAEIEKQYFKYQEKQPDEEMPYNFDFEDESYKEGDYRVSRVTIPIKDKMIYRPLRNNRNSFQLLKPYQRNFLEDLKIFHYSSIFEYCNIDNKDNFIVQFTNHVSLLHEDLINAIMKNLTTHIEKFHNIKKVQFNFTKLRNILAKDFSNCPNPNLEEYSAYFLRELSHENFCKVISQMIIEEGDLFINVNRIFSNKQINSYLLFYILCLIYVYDTEANHNKIDVTYKSIEAIDLNLFKEKNILMNFELMSTTKKKQYIDNMKNIIEISYERIINKNWYLSFRGLDTESFSQYQNEGEVIIHPYCLFEVLSIEVLNNNNFYIKLFLKSNCLSDCGYLNMSRQMELNIGLCLDGGTEIKETYSNIEFDKVISLTITNKESLKSNKTYIGCMKNLRVLDIKNIDLEDEDLLVIIPYMSNLTFLSYLNISMNNLSAKSIKELVQIFCLMPFMEYLNLNQNNLGDEGAMELANGLQCFHQLRSLNLMYNQIKSQGIEALASQIVNCPKIKMLNFSTNYIYHENMDSLLWAVGQLKNLSYLNLSNNQISTEGLALLGDHLPNTIQYLNFSENEITQEGIMDFSTNLIKTPNLLHLILYGNKNGPSGISCLSEHLNDIPKLQILNLGCNYIGDPEVLLLAQNLVKLPLLEQLNLRENQITNDGLLLLLPALNQLFSLKELDLGTNSINDDSFAGLTMCLTQLKYFICLNLECNPISNDDYLTLLNTLQEYDPKWSFNKGEYSKSKYNRKEKFGDLYILQKKTVTKEILRFNNCDNEHLNQELMKIEKYEHVKQLILSRDKLEMSSLKLLVNNMIFLTQLRELDLRCNEIRDEGLIELSRGLKYIPLVENIILRENNIGDKGIKVFAYSLHHLIHLKALNLNWNNISDEGMIALSHANVSHLEILKLKENNIGKDGIIEFSNNLNKFIKLKYLDLGWNKIGEEGMKAFSDNMFFLNELSFLLLSKNEIGDNGIISFSLKLSQLSKLETLLLWNNKIGNKGGESLLGIMQKCMNIKTIDLSINKMTEDVKQKFRDLGETLKISIDI